MIKIKILNNNYLFVIKIKAKNFKQFTVLQKTLCDIIYHRYQIKRFLQPENKHKPLIEAYNLIESTSLITNSREKSEYQLNLLLYLVQVFSRAEDEKNLTKYFKKYLEILNTISKENRIVYANRILKLLKLIVKSNANSPSANKYDILCYQHLNKIEKIYTDFFEITPEFLNDKLFEMNFIFSDFYFCAAHMLKEINIDDSVVSMVLANQIYYHKLGALSQSYKETSLFISSNKDKTSLDNLDGES